MTASIQPPSVSPAAQPEAAAAVRPGFLRRALLVAILAGLLFALTYAFAWFNASRLSARFIQDADAAYDQGEYLESLVGTERFDPQINKYVKQGGYLNVEKIWSSSYSWPAPPELERASQRTQEIVNQRLTIEMAEEYIRANTGRPAPYFGEIYLRLGELYEQEGDLPSARDIYESILELFPNRPDLIEKAQAHLERLEGT
ncbi:MAG TPA: tetratricopeptide repeat protein [Anaerolineales bacterium]|nr:tetratricopeptide repeat protein [Anaerolineales bacterium]